MARLKREYSYDELQEMSIQDLMKINKKVRDDATRNIRKLKKAGYLDDKGKGGGPALNGLKKKIEIGIVRPIKQVATKRPKVRKVSKSERLIAEIEAFQTFASRQTSTVQGMQKFEEDIRERIGDAYGDSSKESKRAFWRLYDEQRSFISDMNLSSDELQKKLANFWSVNDRKRITKKAKEEWEKIVMAEYADQYGTPEEMAEDNPDKDLTTLAREKYGK